MSDGEHHFSRAFTFAITVVLHATPFAFVFSAIMPDEIADFLPAGMVFRIIDRHDYFFLGLNILTKSSTAKMENQNMIVAIIAQKQNHAPERVGEGSISKNAVKLRKNISIVNVMRFI